MMKVFEEVTGVPESDAPHWEGVPFSINRIGRHLAYSSFLSHLVPSTPYRNPVSNLSILVLAHVMRPLGLPVCHSLESFVARQPQRIRPDASLGVVWNVLTGVAQVLHIDLRR